MEKLKRAVFDLWLSNMKYQDIMKKYKLTSSKLNLIILEGLEENKDSLLQKYHHAIVLYQSGLSMKYIENRLDIDRDKFIKILKVFQQENRLSKTDKKMIPIQINNGMDIDSIAKLYCVNRKVIDNLLLDFNVNQSVCAKLPETKKTYSYKDMVEKGCFSIVKDAYVCGKTFDDLKRLYNLSDAICYSVATDCNISTGKIDNFCDLYIYKHFLSEAYDNNIITDDMLKCLFQLDEKSAEYLNLNYDGSVQSYLSCKLYQIYLMPSLLNDFNFLNENMKKDAQNFINRRYSEEFLKLKESHASSWEFDNLREMYYASRQNRYLEKVLNRGGI